MTPTPNDSRRTTELLRSLESTFSNGVQNDPSSLFKAREVIAKLAGLASGGEDGQKGILSVLQTLLEHMLRDKPIGMPAANEMAAELIGTLAAIGQGPAATRRTVSSPQNAVGSVTGLLENSRRPTRSLPFRSSTDERIGELLMRTGRINAKQLNQAIVAQKISHKLLGEVLVDLGAITMAVLYTSLEEQREQAGGLRMRRVMPS